MKENRDDRLEKIQPLKLYTLAEIEPILGVSHRTLLEWVKLKKIDCVKVGGKWKISEEKLRAFVNGKRK